MSKKGSFTIEAALIFPVFIMLWVPFLYLVRYCLLYEAMQQVNHQTAMTMSTTGYLFDRAGLRDIQEETVAKGEVATMPDFGEAWEDTLPVLQGSLNYCQQLLNSGADLSTTLGREAWKLAVNEVGKLAAGKIMESLGETRWSVLGTDDEPQLTYSDFFYMEDTTSDWISLVMYVPVKWADPLGLFTNQTIAVSTQVRTFIGLPWEKAGMDESETENETYYRIGQGKKYHSLDCYLIQKDVQLISREQSEAGGYQPCGHCETSLEMVWVTPGGERYHAKGCSHLFPNVVELTTAEIVSGAYGPCALCQTDGGWFP